MKRALAATFLMPLILAAGCGRARQVKVTYESDPHGGTLYKLNGEVWGPCPKVLWYDLNDEVIRNGYLHAKGVIVRWPSGPERRSGDLIKITVNGTDRRVILTQPRTAATAARGERLGYRRY